MSGMTVNIIWELAQKYHINLIVEHIPGELNQEADHLRCPVSSRATRQKPRSGNSTRGSSTGFSRNGVRSPAISITTPAPQLHSVEGTHNVEGTPSQCGCVPSPLAGRGLCIPSVCSDLQRRVLRKVRRDKCWIVLTEPCWGIQT